MGSQRYPQHLGATTVLQITVATVSIIANQPLTNRAGRPFSSIVAETLRDNHIAFLDYHAPNLFVKYF